MIFTILQHNMCILSDYAWIGQIKQSIVIVNSTCK